MIAGPSLVKYNTAVLVSTSGDKSKATAGSKKQEKKTTQTEVTIFTQIEIQG